MHPKTVWIFTSINTDVCRIVPANRERNISLISLLSCTKINNYKLIDGPYNTMTLVEFLEESWFCKRTGPNDIFYYIIKLESWTMFVIIIVSM